MTTDDRVVSAAKEGDADAWRRLYERHAGRLLVWLGSQAPTDPVAAAEDLAAEAWLTAAGKINDFRGTEDEFAGWLFGIARNLAANARRKGGRRLRLARAEAPAAAAPAGAWIEEVSRVRSLLAALPERERHVVGCLDVVGLDVDTTARALGMTRTAVRVAHHRGLARLRRAGVLDEDAVSPAR